MDIKKVLHLIESAEQSKQTLTEGKNMAKEMVMQHYTKQDSKSVVKKSVSRLNEYFKVVDNEMLNVIKEEQDAKRVEVKRIVNRVLERLDEGKKAEAPKPRNFVAKNQQTSGAGAHKDKKKAEKQGDVKHKKQAVPLDEKAPPGEKAERMVKHIKKGYAKDGKLTDKEKSIAYATAWKHHNKKTDEGVAGPEKCWPGHRKVGTKPGTGKNAGKRVNDCEKIKEAIEVGSSVKVYSNVLKKPVYGHVVELKENKAYVNYANTKIVMAHPVTKVELVEATAAAPAAAGIGSKLARFIPGVGLVAGGYDAYQRAKQGDYTGAAISAGAGLAGLVPGIGTAAATGLIGAQLGRDKARTGSFLPSYDEIGQAGKQPAAQTTAPASDTTNPPAQAATPAPTPKDGKAVPAPAATPITSYKIQKGDNLTKIARANNTTVDALMKANPQIKDPNKIFAGTNLNIPGQAAPQQSATPAPIPKDSKLDKTSGLASTVASSQLDAPKTGTVEQPKSTAANPTVTTTQDGKTTTTSGSRTNTTVSGTIKMGKPEGPIQYNGKTVNPGDPEYAAASQALIQSQQRMQQARQRPQQPSTAPVQQGAVSREF